MPYPPGQDVHWLFTRPLFTFSLVSCSRSWGQFFNKNCRHCHLLPSCARMQLYELHACNLGPSLAAHIGFACGGALQSYAGLVLCKPYALSLGHIIRLGYLMRMCCNCHSRHHNGIVLTAQYEQGHSPRSRGLSINSICLALYFTMDWNTALDWTERWCFPWKRWTMHA